MISLVVILKLLEMRLLFVQILLILCDVNNTQILILFSANSNLQFLLCKFLGRTRLSFILLAIL